MLFPQNTCADVSGLDQIDLYWSALSEGLERPFDIQRGYWSSDVLNTLEHCIGVFVWFIVCVCVAEVCCSPAPGVPLPQWSYVSLLPKGPYDLILLPQCDAVWEWGQVCSQMFVCVTMSVCVCAYLAHSPVLRWSCCHPQPGLSPSSPKSVNRGWGLTFFGGGILAAGSKGFLYVCIWSAYSLYNPSIFGCLQRWASGFVLLMCFPVGM